MELKFPLLELARLRFDTDGPGVTTLVAGAGCPLRCRYCINKHLLANKTPEWISAEELVRRTQIDNLYFQSTGGGLCFGGGEALLHADFIATVRSEIGAVWRIIAETSLNVPIDVLKTALTCVDDFIADVKTLNAKIYKEYTGCDNASVINNLSLLSHTCDPQRIKLRVPLIPGYIDEKEQAQTAEQLKEMGFSRIELFTYKTDL